MANYCVKYATVPIYCFTPRLEQPLVVCEKFRLTLPSLVKVFVTNTVHCELLLALFPRIVTLDFGK